MNLISLYLLHFVFCFFAFISESEIFSQNIELKPDPRYALEVEDPYHRHVDILRLAYNRWQLAGGVETKDFWIFLEEHREELQVEFPNLYDPAFQMVWLEDEGQRYDYKAVFHQELDGAIGIEALQYDHLSDGKWMFVQMEGTIYVGKEIRFRFHHISLSGGDEVDAAGIFKIVEGKVKGISFVSGHFRPKIPQGQYCLQTLTDQYGLNLDHMPIMYCLVSGDTVVKKKVVFEEFMKLDSEEESGEHSEPPFLIPLEDYLAAPVQVDRHKAKLFFTEEGLLYLGSSRIEAHAPEFINRTLLTPSVKFRENQFSKIILNLDIEGKGILEKIRLFIGILQSYGVDVSQIEFRVLVNHEKQIFSAEQLLQEGDGAGPSG